MANFKFLLYNIQLFLGLDFLYSSFNCGYRLQKHILTNFSHESPVTAPQLKVRTNVLLYMQYSYSYLSMKFFLRFSKLLFCGSQLNKCHPLAVLPMIRSTHERAFPLNSHRLHPAVILFSPLLPAPTPPSQSRPTAPSSPGPGPWHSLRQTRTRLGAPRCCASSRSSARARRSASPRSSCSGGGSALSSGVCCGASNAISPLQRRASDGEMAVSGIVQYTRVRVLYITCMSCAYTSTCRHNSYCTLHTLTHGCQCALHCIVFAHAFSSFFSL